MQNKNNILSPDILETENIDSPIRPNLLQDFIGQEQVKANLTVFIKAAQNRKESLDHTLFYGPPGLGKTSLANIISKEMNVNFRATSGPALSKKAELAALLTNLAPQDVLFIDEIHRLPNNIEEILYSAMEDFFLDIIIGDGPSARSVRIDLPKFTLIGATTRLGLISNPLRDRFGIPLRLNFYKTEELVLVINRAAAILNINITKQGAHEIAMRSRGTPRIALRLLKRVRDFSVVENHGVIDENIASKSLYRLEVDKMGLDSNDYRYIKFIADNYNGGPVGVETIAAALSEQKDAIEETIEPFLIQIGMVQRTPRGRVLTANAFKHLGINAPVGLNNVQEELFLDNN
ncbi:MAG: Holliday junction branch migration DNA helicase RuvB [Rickettsiaceae bacterium]|nr:Holliday junction branch migration DNA helicase RuvB [Rickettsiaceae bacterium]